MYRSRPDPAQSASGCNGAFALAHTQLQAFAGGEEVSREIDDMLNQEPGCIRELIDLPLKTADQQDRDANH
jgi:hypothetical protein